MGTGPRQCANWLVMARPEVSRWRSLACRDGLVETLPELGLGLWWGRRPTVDALPGEQQTRLSTRLERYLTHPFTLLSGGGWLKLKAGQPRLPRTA